MRYVLTVKRLEKNEDYERQIKAWEGQLKYHMVSDIDRGSPQSEIPTNALEVIVTEEEFVAIKKAVLEVIK